MDPTQLYQNIAQPQQPAAPAQGGGFLNQLGGFLGNPAVQGLLGAYFGAVSSPRRMGFGGAIGRGGLGGLEMADQAQSLREQQQQGQATGQYRNQLLGLKDKELGLKGQEVAAKTQAAQAASAGKQPIGKPAAMRILQTNPKMGIDADTLAMYTPDMVRKELDSIRITGQRDPLIQSEIAQHNAETKAAGARVGIEQQELAQHERLGEEELGLKKQQGEEGLGLKRQELAAKQNPAPKPVDPAQRAQRIAQINALWGKNAPGFVSRIEGKQAGYSKAHFQALSDAGATPEEATAMSGYTPTEAAGAPSMSTQPANAAGMPPHASTGEGLPPGSKPNGDGTWTLPDGTRVAPR